MSTWSEDFAFALDQIGEPHPADLTIDGVAELITDLAEAIALNGEFVTVGELIELGAISDVVAAAAALRASYYVGALIGAGIYASANQAWDFLTAPMDLSAIYEMYKQYVPVIDLPVTEDVSQPDLHVEHDDWPPYPGYVLLMGTSDQASTRLIQKRLRSLGYDAGEVDGIFGSDTATAVRQFQKERNLYVDGKVGEDTWPALFPVT